MNEVKLSIRTISGTVYSTEVTRATANACQQQFVCEHAKPAVSGTFLLTGTIDISIALRHVESVMIEDLS